MSIFAVRQGSISRYLYIYIKFNIQIILSWVNLLYCLKTQAKTCRIEDLKQFAKPVRNLLLDIKLSQLARDCDSRKLHIAL
jgi:hypothetical protein